MDGIIEECIENDAQRPKYVEKVSKYLKKRNIFEFFGEFLANLPPGHFKKKD
jgi:hypothetical protein